jgi:formylglycine-generating enzyme required for sulfatase activity
MHWFLSYTSQDFALTQALKLGLQRREPGARIFFAPESMRAGGFWLPQLAEEIANSTAFALLVGEVGVGPWQVMEYYEALDRRVKEPSYPVILILSAKRPAPGLPFARQLHWVLSEDPTSEATIGQLIAAASGPAMRQGELWRHTRPYRGLEAMTEANSDFFFGRGRETVEVINALASERGRLPVLIGNSGVGKSSLAQAGVLASLLRQGWSEHIAEAGPWPVAFDHSRHWCFLTLRPGPDPLKALVSSFLDGWQFGSESERVREQKGFVELLLGGKATLSDLIDATERRHGKLGQPKPPAFFLYIDQGEELYVRAEKQRRRHFSEAVAAGLADPRLRALMSLRADFFGELQKDEPLQEFSRKIEVPPLREAQLNHVVSRPAELLSARFESGTLAADIARRTAEESAEDAGALPLLSYLLDDMWGEMVCRDDGVLRLPMQAIELGRVLVQRANKFVAEHPASEGLLRRILTMKLATVREGEEPTRRRALRSEFSDEEWRLVSELADHPNRLLVTATPESGETYAEVAHEAIFRRWDKLGEWIAAEREFLAWRSGLEAARRAWQAAADTAKNHAPDSLLMGAAFTQAQSWLARRAEDLPGPDREFISLSIARDRKARGRARRIQTLVYALLFGVIGGLVGWINQEPIKEQWKWYWTVRPFAAATISPYVLTAQAERGLKSGGPSRECALDQIKAYCFRECAAVDGKDYCPEMVVVPPGEFMMGSPPSENGNPDEGPQHPVTIAQPFAVSKFAVTFAEWDICAAYGDCGRLVGLVDDSGWERGPRPVINVTWDDAQTYARWLSRMTGKAYRLLTDAEYEYATRAGTQTAYPWGDEIGENNAKCRGCGSVWAGQQAAPVGSFQPNGFGLYDMVGNVFEWVEDCYYGGYTATIDGRVVHAPQDGSAWITKDCTKLVVRGGSWDSDPREVRSAHRNWKPRGPRDETLGFRVARTLSARTGEITSADR